MSIRDGVHHDQVLDHLADHVRRHGHDSGLQHLHAFMLDYLRYAFSALPADARAIFVRAEQIHERTPTDAELNDLRNRCWRAINELDARHNFADPTNCAYRALLCCLQHEPPLIDLVETCSWFLSFCDGIENNADMLPHLVEKHFPTNSRA